MAKKDNIITVYGRARSIIKGYEATNDMEHAVEAIVQAMIAEREAGAEQVRDEIRAMLKNRL